MPWILRVLSKACMISRRESRVRKLVLRPRDSSEGSSSGIKEIISETRPVCIALAVVTEACLRDGE